MEWVNITAKSLPEAIDLALDNLGVDESEAEIVVLEEPKQGLFGRIRGNARVKARVKPRTTRPKVERSRNRKRRGGDGSGERESGARSGRNRGKKRGEDAAASGDNGRASAGRRSQEKSGGKSRSDNGSGGDRSSRKQRRDETPVEEATMEEVGAQLEVFLSGLTDAFGFNGPITIDEDDEGGVLATVDGQHGLMVGPKGRTLEAIQELARVSAQRTTPSSIRIKVDVGGYRSRRQAALESFAQEVAAAAKGDGKERSMEPMSSADRKIVHDALSDMPGIETRSAGAEPRRRVVVVPVGSGEDADGGDDSDDSEVDVSEEAEVVGN